MAAMDEDKLKDPKISTQQYLEKHHVQELIEGLLAELVYNKPANPKQYMVTQLEKKKVAGTKPLLDKQDLHTMFGMFDVTKRGVVTEQQARNALKTLLGSRAPPAPQPPAAEAGTAAAGSNAGAAPLAQDEFVQYMSRVLVEATPLCKGIAGDSTDV